MPLVKRDVVMRKGMLISVADGLAIEISYPKFMEEQYCIPQRIHGTGIFTYMKTIKIK